jgi:hypothetical protein
MTASLDSEAEVRIALHLPVSSQTSVNFEPAGYSLITDQQQAPAKKNRGGGKGESSNALIARLMPTAADWPSGPPALIPFLGCPAKRKRRPGLWGPSCCARLSNRPARQPSRRARQPSATSQARSAERARSFPTVRNGKI